MLVLSFFVYVNTCNFLENSFVEVGQIQDYITFILTELTPPIHAVFRNGYFPQKSTSGFILRVRCFFSIGHILSRDPFQMNTVHPLQQRSGFAVQPIPIRPIRRTVEQADLRFNGIEAAIGKGSLVPVAAVIVAAVIVAAVIVAAVIVAAVIVAGVEVAGVAVAAVAVAAVAVAAVAVAAVAVAAVAVAAVPVAAVIVAAVPVAAVPAAAVPVAAVVVAAVAVAAVAVAAVAVAAVIVAAVIVAAVPVTAVTEPRASLSRVHKFQYLSPRDFPHDLNLIGADLRILAFGVNLPQSNDLCNVILRVEGIVVEAISGFQTEVETRRTARRANIFLERAGTSVLKPSASPIGFENLVTSDSLCHCYSSFLSFMFIKYSFY